ncbi:hypothetical protein [Alkalihalobacillus sp. LMS39]|uniref:hypothetical protein n=1 Tax=Alkalihalobacillus sp. LMS39 TaxID=2924032 RepID=UPI001FB1BD59|nr:hypothetical protein [Alkalihalobacillus sp. LMS39]UOE95248.1 hypothetical protein MM271_06400 [Alkalihalobacillus sp. LMS39]
MKIITLCGSTKFKKQFEKANAYLTLQGNIVISLGFFEQSEGIEITKEQATLFENIHYEKINMSDEIFVIDVNGYIGNSTKKEIEHAKRQGKTIRYYSESEIKE